MIPTNVYNFFSQRIVVSSLIFLLVILLGFFLNKLIKKILLSFAHKTKTKIDDMIVEKFHTVFFYLFLFIAARIFFSSMKILSDFLENLIDSGILILSLYLAARISAFFIKLWTQSISKKLVRESYRVSYVSQSFAPILQKINSLLFFIIGITSLLYLWGVNVTPILGGLGIAGLGISLAAKDLLSNIIGGISLAGDMSFKVGDRVKIPSENISGVVYDIGLRTTRIRTWDNQIIMIPNGVLANAVIINDNQPNLSSRVVIPFSVAYGSDPEKVKEVVLKAIKEIPNVLDDPEPSVVFTDMGDFALKFEAKYWVPDVSMKYEAKLQGVERIYKALNEANIIIPFPTHTVYLEETKRKSTKSRKKKSTRTKK